MPPPHSVIPPGRSWVFLCGNLQALPPVRGMNFTNVSVFDAATMADFFVDAKKLILLTDVCGLMRVPGDDSTLIPRLKVSEVPALIKEGVISGGMIPKVDCCVEAVRQGVERANIQDGRVPHSILIELLTDEGIGTMLY